jgi:hypothetical protein
VIITTRYGVGGVEIKPTILLNSVVDGMSGQKLGAGFNN